MQTVSCFNCKRTEQDIPLLTMHFQGNVSHVCPQCLPALIHKPQTVAANLPGLRASGVDEPEG